MNRAQRTAAQRLVADCHRQGAFLMATNTALILRGGDHALAVAVDRKARLLWEYLRDQAAAPGDIQRATG